MLVHTVFFWLKDDISAEDKNGFADQVQTLATIPSAEAVYVGTPSPTADRPVIDSSYDVSLTVILKDIPSHDIYQEHQIHLDFLKNNSHKWAKVLVYDAD